MPRLVPSSLAAGALALLAACQPPPAPTVQAAPVTSPGLGGAAADQVQVEPIPGLGD